MTDSTLGRLTFNTVDTHTAGEPTRILLDPLLSLPTSGSIATRRDEFEARYDWLRSLLLQEPRGHAGMFGAAPLAPNDSANDLGLIFLDTNGYLEMCGHATIGSVTALIEGGMLPAMETVRIETPAGLVNAWPEYDGNRVASVAIENVESYVVDTVELAWEGDTSLCVDIVFSGNYFALVDTSQLAVGIDQATVHQLVNRAMAIREELNTEHHLVDPVSGADVSIDIVEFYDDSDAIDRNVAVFSDGMVDRSPCGTGTCAKMTLLHAKGDLHVDESYPHEGILGTRFFGRIVDIDRSGEVTVVEPRVRGSAHITGHHTFYHDRSDPITGFTLGKY